MRQIFIILLSISSSVCFSQNDNVNKRKQDPEIRNTRENVYTKGDKTDPLKIDNSKSEVIDDNTIYSNVGLDKPSHYSGKYASFNTYFKENFIVPKELLNDSKKRKNGRIFVEIIIEKDGSVSDAKIIRDLGFGTGAEALRVLKLSPKWVPAKHQGIPLRSRVTLPLSIK
jgi:protein TonB